MSAHEVRHLAVKAHEQGAKLVIPSKGTLATEAQLVDFRIEQAFASAFGLLTGAGVLELFSKPRLPYAEGSIDSTLALFEPTGCMIVFCRNSNPILDCTCRLKALPTGSYWGE